MIRFFKLARKVGVKKSCSALFDNIFDYHVNRTENEIRDTAKLIKDSEEIVRKDETGNFTFEDGVSGQELIDRIKFGLDEDRNAYYLRTGVFIDL